MIVGVDLDNTIIQYDALFRRLAAERGLLVDDGVMSKKAVRDTLWAQQNGRQTWTDIQALAYGPRIDEAVAFPRSLDFFAMCRQMGVTTCIVSHKTEFAASDASRSVNLRAAAMRWLERHGFFGSGSSLRPGMVHFCSTRAEKVRVISRLGCGVFIDDLVEVFEEPGFGHGVRKVLFGFEVPDVPGGYEGDACAHWGDVLALAESWRHE
jgi:hypothetical protein